MRFLNAAGVSVAVVVLATACRSSNAPGPRPSLVEARALALAPPGGDSPADREIARLQERLRNGPVPDDWVLLGQAWIRKARCSGETGLYLAAEGATVAALELAPGHRGALGLRALVLLNQHDFAGAREQARVLVTHDPGDLLALATLSDAALELGDLPAAVDAGQRLLDLKPGLAAYGRAAHLRWTVGDVAGAKLLYARAIEAGRGARDPEPMAWMVVQAAQLFWNEGDLGGAMAGVREALALVPDYPPALVLEGRCHLAGGDIGEAIRVLARAYASRPLVETGWLLADARRRTGDETGAEAIERRLVRDGRQSDPLTLGLFLASRNRDLPEALRMLEAEHRVRPGIAVEDAYAWALFRAGRLAEARAAIDRATVHGTPEPRMLYHAGAIRLAQGEREVGTALVRRALSLNPHFELLARAEVQLLTDRPERQARRP